MSHLVPHKYITRMKAYRTHLVGTWKVTSSLRNPAGLFRRSEIAAKVTSSPAAAAVAFAVALEAA